MSSSDKSNLQFREKNFEKAMRAVQYDDIDTFKNILPDLAEFNILVDERNRNLLHLSVYYERLEIFTYLLSLGGFDLEATDRRGETALDMVFLQSWRIRPQDTDLYVANLIGAGANIGRICYRKNTYLHLAVGKNLIKTAELLIQKGADVNARNDDGETPLHRVFGADRICDKTISESICFLLDYGADLTICDQNGYTPFDRGVIKNLEVSTLEHLFYCTFDYYLKHKIPVEVLSKLIDDDSPLLVEVVDVISEVIYDDDHYGYFRPIHLFKIKPDILQILIKKCNSSINKVLSYDEVDGFEEYLRKIDNWKILLNSELRFEMIEFIGKLKFDSILVLDDETEDDTSSQTGIDLVFYLLTYGLNFNKNDYKYVFENLGYCGLFTTMLHLDAILVEEELEELNPMLRIISDIHCDLDTILAHLDFDSCFLSSENFHILDNFAHPKLRRFCERSYDDYLVAKAKELPTVPLLVELARNATRTHLVSKHNLKKTSQYYTLLKGIEISTIHEKILTFETKLY